MRDQTSILDNEAYSVAEASRWGQTNDDLHLLKNAVSKMSLRTRSSEFSEAAASMENVLHWEHELPFHPVVFEPDKTLL